jgi:ribose 5-phosphate isomerase B
MFLRRRGLFPAQLSGSSRFAVVKVLATEYGQFDYEMPMKIAIGCDEAAFDLKETLKSFLAEQVRVELELLDFGVFSRVPVDYPDIALQVAEAIARGTCDRGILLCGTGLGMAIAANKVAGIRAATCHDVYSAERAQRSNNAQVITLGARVIGPEVAKMVVASWLSAKFNGGASARKVAKICEIEQKHLHGVHCEPSTTQEAPA